MSADRSMFRAIDTGEYHEVTEFVGCAGDAAAGASGSNAYTVTGFRGYAAQVKEETVVERDALLSAILHTCASTKERLPWLKFARFGSVRTRTRSLRHDANVLVITGAMGDYDDGEVSFDEAVERVRHSGIEAILYTSPIHTADKPRWRVIAPFSRELPPDQHAEMVNRLNGAIGGGLAAESWTLSQAYFFGSVQGKGVDYRVEFVDGDPIDARDDLPRIGKPPRKSNGTGGMGGDGFDEEAAIAHIVAGDAYHMPTVRLAGYWAFHRVPMDQAIARLRAAFDDAGVQDERWRERRDDVERCVRDIYAKEVASQRGPRKSGRPG